MARILILGADGMVGHVARLHLKECGHDVLAVARSRSTEWDAVNAEDEMELLRHIDERRPAFILNCIGVLIKESEEEPERAIRLNALLPRILAKHGASAGYKLIHVSSDCVFSGASGPYREKDRRDANEIYGRTKALGEIDNRRDLTIRTSKVGPELHEGGSGLFHWFMQQRGTIRGFGRAMWGGVTTLEMAKLVDWVTRNDVTGLVHLTNGEAISKYQLLCLFSEVWGKTDVAIERDDSRSIDRSLLCSRDDFRYRPPSYRDMMLELRDFMKRHMFLYNHYSGVI